jgi:hypothetical protein
MTPFNTKTYGHPSLVRKHKLLTSQAAGQALCSTDWLRLLMLTAPNKHCNSSQRTEHGTFHAVTRPHTPAWSRPVGFLATLMHRCMCPCTKHIMPWAWRKTAWEVALCAEGSGFDSCPLHGAFLWGNGIVIVRLAEWPVPLWGLSEG